MKQYFQTMVDDVTSEGETNTLKDLEEFDDDVRNMLDVRLLTQHSSCNILFHISLNFKADFVK